MSAKCWFRKFRNIDLKDLKEFKFIHIIYIDLRAKIVEIKARKI